MSAKTPCWLARSWQTNPRPSLLIPSSLMGAVGFGLVILGLSPLMMMVLISKQVLAAVWQEEVAACAHY